MSGGTVRVVALIIAIVALALAIVSLATPWYTYTNTVASITTVTNCYVDGTCRDQNGNSQSIANRSNDQKLGTYYTATMALMIVGAIFTLFAVLILLYKVYKGKSVGHHHSRMGSVILASLFFIAATVLFAVGVSNEQNQTFWAQNSVLGNLAVGVAGPSAGWYLCLADAILLLINIFVARV